MKLFVKILNLPYWIQKNQTVSHRVWKQKDVVVILIIKLTVIARLKTHLPHQSIMIIWFFNSKLLIISLQMQCIAWRAIYIYLYMYFWFIKY